MKDMTTKTSEPLVTAITNGSFSQTSTQRESGEFHESLE
jgi:hypothetical protein